MSLQKCDKCGQSFTPTKAHPFWCEGCSQELEQQVLETLETVAQEFKAEPVCIHCGMKTDSGKDLCIWCGKPHSRWI